VTALNVFAFTVVLKLDHLDIVFKLFVQTTQAGILQVDQVINMNKVVA
jgi:hypothetical protein